MAIEEKKSFKTGNDIIDIQQILAEKEKELHGKDDLLCMTLMTFPMYISSSRAIMFTSHLKQYVCLNEPEHPKVFTNYEKVFGNLSSSIKRAKSNFKVIDKISKFKSNPKHLYFMFIYDKENDKYDVIIKRNSVELTEKFGYGFNNEKMDKLKVGDKISKGETIYKSTSYDEDDLYGYGLNAKTLYLIDNRTIEDAIVISESFANKMISKEVETIKVSLNDNDFFVNLYGNNEIYRGFPDINERIKKNIICAHRRIINDQILYDLKKSNLKDIFPLDDRIYYSKSDGEGAVIDIDIFSNKPIDEIPVTEQNEQIIEYLKNQNRFYKEVHERCDKILKSGSKYSDDVAFWWKRSKDILDPRYKWKDNNSVFGNMVIEFTVQRNVGVGRGNKLTGRLIASCLMQVIAL